MRTSRRPPSWSVWSPPRRRTPRRQARRTTPVRRSFYHSAELARAAAEDAVENGEYTNAKVHPVGDYSVTVFSIEKEPTPPAPVQYPAYGTAIMPTHLSMVMAQGPKAEQIGNVWAASNAHERDTTKPPCKWCGGKGMLNFAKVTGRNRMTRCNRCLGTGNGEKEVA